MATEIHKLIETNDFFHYSQGLFKTSDRTKVGNEILFRSKIGNPDVIFQEAQAVKRLYELEKKSIFKSLNTYFSKLDSFEERLFINIYPSTLLNHNFLDFINEILYHFPIKKEMIVFEILESEQIECMSLLKERVHFLKDMGFLIAMDDVGKGWSSSNMIIEIEPHYIKLDHYFSIDLAGSKPKQEMIKFFLQYAKQFNIQVVIEGIEYESDLEMAKHLGIPICQGFFLEKPKPMAI